MNSQTQIRKICPIEAEDIQSPKIKRPGVAFSFRVSKNEEKTAGSSHLMLDQLTPNDRINALTKIWRLKWCIF